jgi:hypothetical protein
MQKIGTGQTVYDLILSLDGNNNPVTASTFAMDVFKENIVYTGVTVNISLANSLTGTFASTWSADTIGNYQIYYKNLNTSVVYISENYQVVSDSELQTNIYVGI